MSAGEQYKSHIPTILIQTMGKNAKPGHVLIVHFFGGVPMTWLIFYPLVLEVHPRSISLPCSKASPARWSLEWPCCSCRVPLLSTWDLCLPKRTPGCPGRWPRVPMLPGVSRPCCPACLLTRSAEPTHAQSQLPLWSLVPPAVS